MGMFTGKAVLVIGGTGTIGQALVKRVLAEKPKVVRIFSRDEYKQFMMQEELLDFDNVRFLIGDVRDKQRLSRAMSEVDTVFDLAAIKHVPVAEYNPFEAVQTNVLGTQNVIECALENKVKKVIYTSSDKAVSPTNTMGATKLLAERLIASADYSKGGVGTVFAAVRFGNVLGSRGSVIPLWKKQIINSKSISVTDPQMTRFMMTIPQAAELVIQACQLAQGGEVFVLKMPVMKLGDLALEIIEEFSYRLGISPNIINIKEIGLRPGEKLYEELMTIHESLTAVEFENMFAILPHHKTQNINSLELKRAKAGEYSSHKEEPLSREAIHRMLADAEVI